MFNIKIPVPSVHAAFDMLAHQIRALDWFKQNNRMYRWEYYQKLNNPIINEMIIDRNMDRKSFDDKYFQKFGSELYKKDAYTDRIFQIKEAISKLQLCYDRFENLKKSWGFEILPEYHVDINLYGTGGSYHKDDKDCGHIIIGKTERLALIIGHEMLHLGIEDLIINPNYEKEPPIKQEEKERIVDNLCIYTMKGILPLERIWKDGTKSDYQEVASGADYMDAVVGEQPQNNLVLSVQEFLKKQGQ